MLYGSPKMDVFVISWAGRHQDAIAIIKQLQRYSPKVVYSDPSPDLVPAFPSSAIRRPNHLFWGDKFQACLNATTSDMMLVIHADCRCHKWDQLVQRFADCSARNPDVGVWAPSIEGTIHT